MSVQPRSARIRFPLEIRDGEEAMMMAAVTVASWTEFLLGMSFLWRVVS